MSETPVQFGAANHLSGILTEPHGRPRGVCVLVSAGLVPKFGPFRLYTYLARRLADDGLAVLRFDLSGIGDSLPVPSDDTLSVRTRDEIAAAVGFLDTRFPNTGVSLAGLCSGAEDSFRYAAVDPRVTSVMMIDPFSYRTSGWGWRHARFRLVRRALRILGVYKTRARGTALPAGMIEYEYMHRDESRQILTSLVSRGARVHFIYTGGVRETFNHPGQLRKMFPDVDFAGRVTIDYLPHVTHTQMLQEDREQLGNAARRWLCA